MSKTLLESLRAQRKAKFDELNAIVPKPDDANAKYTDADDERAGGLLAEIAKLDSRISELDELDKRETAAAEARKETGNAGKSAGNAHVTDEPEVYVRGGEHSWVQDAYTAFREGNRVAMERLERHANVVKTEKRDVGTATFGGLIPPKYLEDLFAPNVRAGRPTANAVMNLPLPDTGMSFVIPRGTTPTAVAVQATENTAVQETDFAETDLTITVTTIAGQQDMSRQSVERGSGLDQIVFADLSADYAVKLNQQVLYGTGANNQVLGILRTSGINAVAYTDATPTVGEIYAKIADAIQQIVTNRYLPPTGIVMHPRRWAWFTAALDSTGRPLVTNTAPSNPAGVGDAAAYGQVVGSIQGLPVITDASIPTTYTAGTITGGTEDVIVVARFPDLLLWENAPVPRQLRFEETAAGSLSIKLVCYGYAAFTAARYPKSVATITGTGTAPPTF